MYDTSKVLMMQSPTASLLLKKLVCIERKLVYQSLNASLHVQVAESDLTMATIDFDFVTDFGRKSWCQVSSLLS